MKKYRVLTKHLRRFPEGTILVPGPAPSFRPEKHKPMLVIDGEVAGYGIPADVVDRNPDWFEEIEPEQPQPSEPDAVAVLRDIVGLLDSGPFPLSVHHQLEISERAKAVLSSQPIRNEWEEKYNALRNKAIAKNARLISVLKTVIDYANGGYLNDQKKDTLDLCEKAIAEFRLNETTPPLSEQADSRADFKREVDLAERNGLVIANIKLMAERKELAAALNRIVYAYRNAQSTELSRAIFDTDEILSKYV